MEEYGFFLTHAFEIEDFFHQHLCWKTCDLVVQLQNGGVDVELDLYQEDSKEDSIEQKQKQRQNHKSNFIKKSYPQKTWEFGQLVSPLAPLQNSVILNHGDGYPSGITFNTKTRLDMLLSGHQNLETLYKYPYWSLVIHHECCHHDWLRMKDFALSCRELLILEQSRRYLGSEAQSIRRQSLGKITMNTI